MTALRDVLPGGEHGAAEERVPEEAGTAEERPLGTSGQAAEGDLKNQFKDHNARELRQIWESQTATHDQLRTLSSKLDKMHNLVNKMHDGMNQVKQGVANVQQRLEATAASTIQRAMPERRRNDAPVGVSRVKHVSQRRPGEEFLIDTSLYAKDDCVPIFQLIQGTKTPWPTKKICSSWRSVSNRGTIPSVTRNFFSATRLICRGLSSARSSRQFSASVPGTDRHINPNRSTFG
ncbi:truncated ER mannose-binding lectin [Culex quinquefasciatus]|uniref:Truncated ER mannose-binding lectin n=1 Tax=Culex quinquefasciatus TaxID=7176 RepID=B0WP22_CULQU|nr:truncated ER mannose-binding lectin [Culex quinquefasciatus]|eukprot:XP_001850456.1 truncated ER mannose-binding lectin [Culex quinquefasciatus]